MTCESQNTAVSCTTRETWQYVNGIVMQLCDAHAYAIIHSVDKETVREHLTSMTVSRVTIKCDTCSSTYRLEHVGITTVVGMPKYCPHCGSKSTAFNDPEKDYWELLSESLKLPLSITLELYDAWDNSEYKSFRDFVDAMRKASVNA